MAFLRPWVPFREMEKFQHTVDEVLEHLRGKIGYPLVNGSAALKPLIESFVEEGNLTVRVELPGIDPKDITVNVVGDMLTIRASRQEEHETKKRDFLHREFEIWRHRTLDDPPSRGEGRRHQGKNQRPELSRGG